MTQHIITQLENHLKHLHTRIATLTQQGHLQLTETWPTKHTLRASTYLIDQYIFTKQELGWWKRHHFNH